MKPLHIAYVTGTAKDHISAVISVPAVKGRCPRPLDDGLYLYDLNKMIRNNQIQVRCDSKSYTNSFNDHPAQNWIGAEIMQNVDYDQSYYLFRNMINKTDKNRHVRRIFLNQLEFMIEMTKIKQIMENYYAECYKKPLSLSN